MFQKAIAAAAALFVAATLFGVSDKQGGRHGELSVPAGQDRRAVHAGLDDRFLSAASLPNVCNPRSGSPSSLKTVQVAAR